MFNFKSIADKCMPMSCSDTKGNKVKWMEMKWIQFWKLDPESMYFKYKFDEEEFYCLRLKSTTRNCTYRISDVLHRCTKKSFLSQRQKRKTSLHSAMTRGPRACVAHLVLATSLGFVGFFFLFIFSTKCYILNINAFRPVIGEKKIF